MRVYAIILTNYSNLKILSEIMYLDDFLFFQKSSIIDAIHQVNKITAGLTPVNQRKSISHEGYLCHTSHQIDGIVGTIITDEEYPIRVAYDVLSSYLGGSLIDIKMIQDPNNFDKLTKIKKDLGETKEIIIQTIEQLLDRGEKLDELEDRSDELVREARKFKTQSEKMNSCCIIL